MHAKDKRNEENVKGTQRTLWQLIFPITCHPVPLWLKTALFSWTYDCWPKAGTCKDAGVPPCVLESTGDQTGESQVDGSAMLNGGFFFWTWENWDRPRGMWPAFWVWNEFPLLYILKWTKKERVTTPPPPTLPPGQWSKRITVLSHFGGAGNPGVSFLEASNTANVCVREL